jgi:pullulanase
VLPVAALSLMLLIPGTAPATDLRGARAHWVAPGLVAWDVGPIPAGSSFHLHVDPEGGLRVEGSEVRGGRSFEMRQEPSGLPAALRERFPHLAQLSTFRLPADLVREAPSVLRGQVVVSARRADGSLGAVTALQTPGVLDALFATEEPLGVSWQDGVPTLRVWAPTAREVKLLLFADAAPDAVPEVVPMHREGGTFAARGRPEWLGRFYLYEVDVFVRGTGRFETNRVTDPYSLSLSRNSLRSQIVDLDAAALKPEGWDTLRKPPFEAPEDMSVYELHVRDFSAGDPEVPVALRGTFGAFALQETHGVRHLRALAAAGLTHLHLLPAFDIASVDDDRTTWQDPGDLAGLPPDSDRQQAAVQAVAARDGFNWGYDPFHYTVPEGSYSTDPDGPRRIVEFREMVAALNRLGLRVVMDVVYNHTFAAGQAPKSVLDRIVPGYYHRLDADGVPLTSTCCPNTATEHAMMGRLMVDSVVTWARDYKVDGFRFDLMGHHLKRNMLEVRQALDALTPTRDGVDGRSVYVYGEGWDFGEMANGGRGQNATQRHMAGTGIGSFSDRLRDAARGGSAFGPPTEQGFLTGLADAPNGFEKSPPDARQARMRALADLIKVGIAGNLAAFRFADREGRLARGDEIDYNGQPAGFTADPGEVVTYVEAHDNETLFDAIQVKAPPELPMAERVRMQMLGMSLVAFSQGVAFFHAGVDLLRSKSLDRNSYDSGDHFNRLDFTGHSNNWGVGLPPARDNAKHWDLMRPLLADPALRPAPAHIAAARDHLQRVLRIRRSSPLFRLRTAADVQRHLRFGNTGPGQLAGVVAFELVDREGDLDREHSRIVVVLNGLGSEVELQWPELAGARLALHDELREGPDLIARRAAFDSPAGVFDIPGRTAAVFLERRP